MSHEISMQNGRANMAFVGAVPWHGLGQSLQPGATMEEWLAAAGMDYSICRSRVRFGAEDAPRVWDDQHVLFRSDNKLPLAVVSSRYQIVQPREVLEFFRNLCAEHGFELETAGTLYDGARYWALAKMPLGFELPGRDTVTSYALLATSCDGSLATTGMHTSVRTVCQNTLSAGLRQGGKSAIRVKHSTEFRASKMQVDMGLLGKSWQSFAEHAGAMARSRISTRDAVKLLIAAMGDESKPVDDQPNARPMAAILKTFESGGIGDTESARGTAWGLVNAATQYYDHDAGRSANTRLASAWFGRGATLKEAVYDTVLERVIEATGDGGMLHAAIGASEQGGLLDSVLGATTLQ